MSLVAWLSGNLLRYPFFTAFHFPPEHFVIETPKGLFRQEKPLTARAAYVFLTLLALTSERELKISRYQFLKKSNLKLYNWDLHQLLLSLKETVLHFEGCFYENGAFKTRTKLSLIEDLRLEGAELEIRFSPWVLESAYPVDVTLFGQLSRLARRLYLYFSFTLAQGPFKLGQEHLKKLVPVTTKTQERLFRKRLPAALEELKEAGLLEFKELPEEEAFVLEPGEAFLRFREEASSLKAPICKTVQKKRRASSRSPNLLYLGREYCGKSQRLQKMARRAEKTWGLKALYLPCLYSLSDWLSLNFKKEEYQGLSSVEKRALLVKTARERVVLVDDLERATFQKQELIKSCLDKAPFFVCTARTYRAIPETIRLTLERRGFREIELKSQATKDLTFAVLAVVVLLAVLCGHYEWLVGLMAARFILRQPV